MMMMSRPKGKRDPALIRAAVKSFMKGEKLTEIAARYGVKQPSVSYWLRKHGPVMFPKTFKLRKQGRRKSLVPCERDQEILRLVAVEQVSYAELGRRFGITRSRVDGIVKIWTSRNYKVPPPFKAGDSVVLKGKTYRVLRVKGTISGRVRSLETNKVTDPFLWVQDGQIAVISFPVGQDDLTG